MASVAIAHDYLHQRGGAERVVLELEADRLEAPPETLAARVQRFSIGAFQERIRTALTDVYAAVH